MKSSDWRHYRGHLIVKSKGFLGLDRFEVWCGRSLLGTFASVDAKVLSWIKGWQSYEAAIYTSNLTKQANADRQAAVAAATAPQQSGLVTPPKP
jgi:hypothetical protein